MATHARSMTILILALGLAACGDDGGATDAAPGNPDAAAGPDAASCAADLNPASDGTSVATDLVISEISPGDHIELYNNTAQAVDLSSSAYQLCSPFVYASLASLGTGVVIAPGGRATLTWPPTFTDEDAGGEVMLYKDSSFNANDSIVDFICWGTNPHGSRLSQGTASGKWSGSCAGAITGGAIHRIAGSDGTEAASYDVASAPSPENCQ